MIILRSDHKSDKLVLIFGLGLIGTSILNRFSRNYCKSEYMPFCWGDHSLQNIQLDNIFKYIEQINNFESIDIIWSAGKGGFSLSDIEFESELISFKLVVSFSRSLARKYLISLSFHLFSSAGGLFEGIRLVDFNTIPNPIRLYGSLKLLQENYLLSFSNEFQIYIYRPSTVFGYSPNSRVGLISNLLIRSVTNQFVEIYASKSTLRDYIFVDDIANFIYNNIVLKPKNGHIFFLVSGKASSIDEIIWITSGFINKDILFSFKAMESNALDNTYSANLVPKGLNPTSLSFGIIKTLKKIIS